jgi:hypothetical protein
MQPSSIGFAPLTHHRLRGTIARAAPSPAPHHRPRRTPTAAAEAMSPNGCFPGRLASSRAPLGVVTGKRLSPVGRAPFFVTEARLPGNVQ